MPATDTQIKSFKTNSGNNYYYSSFDNKIYPLCGNNPCNRGYILNYCLDDKYDVNNITTFIIEITQQCNLRCKYCCYSGDYENRRSHGNVEMSQDTLCDCIHFIETHLNPRDEQINVDFYGGEALLAREKIEWVIHQLINKLPTISFNFYISSNGILLNEENIRWIHNTPGLNITITIDGDKKQHDKNRVSSTGKGSFDIIMRNLSVFKSLFPESFKNKVRFISTVSSIEDIITLNDFWCQNSVLQENRPFHISYIIPNFKKGEAFQSHEDKFINFYNQAFQCYKENKNNILSDEFKRLINRIEHRAFFCLPETQTFSSCLNNQYSCFISANGELYICEKMTQNHRLGNLKTGVDLNKCKSLNESFYQRKQDFCSSCWANRLCRICATNLNYSNIQFSQYCEFEKMKISTALLFYCEKLEYEKNFKINR